LEILNSHSNFEFEGKIKFIGVTYLEQRDLNGYFLILWPEKQIPWDWLIFTVLKQKMEKKVFAPELMP
jgi:hypothetical protein